MNIKALHTSEKPVSAISLLKAFGKRNGYKNLQEKIKEHITKTPALLICVEGQVLFENEKGIREILMPGDYVHIEPMVKHWVNGTMESQLVLVN
ncbi:MAG: hypothetical protein IPN60_10650 [Saprospiraceae bacterium]|nr:hypothetical protein [Candidatus Opimibacter skivensis]